MTTTQTITQTSTTDLIAQLATSTDPGLDRVAAIEELTDRAQSHRATTYAVAWGVPLDSGVDAQGLPADAALDTVRGYCAAYGLTAELHDEAGFRRGVVQSNGSYRLA